jgi:hypothetical protein
MMYQCPKGHQSTDADYCSECGALIGQPKVTNTEASKSADINKQQAAPKTGGEICPDCGTQRVGDARFCEVCRHDFQQNTTGVAEAIVASQQPAKPSEDVKKDNDIQVKESIDAKPDDGVSNIKIEAAPVVSQRLNVIITVDKDKVSSWDGESPIKPDSVDRVFPLDLDENLVGRRSQGKGIYPEIEINDPGVSHRHLKFIKQADGGFAVLELGSSNGTELNGTVLEPGVNTVVKTGDELTIGIWTRLKIVAR